MSLALAVAVALAPAATAAAGERAVPGDEVFGAVAQAVLEHRTANLVEGAAPSLAPLPVAGQVRLSIMRTHEETEIDAELTARRLALAGMSEAYTGSTTQVDVESTTVDGDKVVAVLNETTELAYKQIRGDEPPNTAFQSRHEAVFTAAPGGGWELTAMKPLDEGPNAVNQPDAEVVDPGGALPKEGESADTREPATPSTGEKTTLAASYNYYEMANYAERHWKNYNKSYRRFSDVGGDCTNFISQALRAGGWAHDTGLYTDYRNWWYNSLNQSRSWVNVNYWASFALHSKRTYNLKNVYQLARGDILQMDFSNNGSKDHSMITTYRSASGVPYLTYHSRDTYRKSVASIVASNPRAIYYAFRT
ncbi:amidase domain-containing protein [Streptomyces sp. NPDC087440]|uniref:amidase domain-containing protein n=1 Tax=Streptomyces sp. NPDC087440 TaxID=3365790 RepID=UPI00382B5286